MLKYNIIIKVEDESVIKDIIMSVNYESEYHLKSDVINIGKNGILDKIENDYVYFPSHKIIKIDIKKID